MNRHPHELLGAYADGELAAAETARVAEHLATCTECTRELALIRSMGGAMRSMVQHTPPRGLWDRVHRRITRPIGWLLVLAAVLTWSALIAVEWYRERELTWEYAAATGFAIGIVMIAASVGYEQYRDWKETRYKDIER
jgi:anti-sigma factor RsiW